MRKLKISASLMCANLLCLQKDLQVLQPFVDFWHLDIGDGRFVPNLTFGFDTVNALLAKSKLPCDIHLMVEKPGWFIERLKVRPKDFVLVHPESKGWQKALRKIKCQKGLVLNPETSLSVVAPFLNKISVVCLMSVQPGFAGQKFIEGAVGKAGELRRLVDESRSGVEIEIDGGIGYEQIKALVPRGASIFVAGSSTIFKDRNIGKNAKKLREFLDKIANC